MHLIAKCKSIEEQQIIVNILPESLIPLLIRECIDNFEKIEGADL